jgi:hypothetical protein
LNTIAKPDTDALFRNLQFRIDVAIDFEKLARFLQGVEKVTEILEWHRGCTPSIQLDNRTGFVSPRSDPGGMHVSADR